MGAEQSGAPCQKDKWSDSADKPDSTSHNSMRLVTHSFGSINRECSIHSPMELLTLPDKNALSGFFSVTAIVIALSPDLTSVVFRVNLCRPGVRTIPNCTGRILGNMPRKDGHRKSLYVPLLP